ncbi:hypothetical protein B0H17DRAFT_1145204 [Mycena rosella]|uniref:Uncharacterized protein n=1 Tax=Mycena rosella TaxID=1033263 RepID=A0AAD7CUG0_MYCRO|nr:hypothetical protein B0H17DRAFT_1145204 [Mycena rosella]
MRTTITYFSHSTYSATRLKVLRVIIQVNKGLEISKTRFGTMYWASYALLRCLLGINELISTGIIEVDGSDKACGKTEVGGDMIHGPSGDLFLSGFFLDPRKFVSFARAKVLTVVAEHVKSPDLHDSMPSSEKVGKFLFQVLAKEIQSGREASEFARYSTAAQVMAAFKSQFEAYTRQYPPFNRCSPSWSKAMHYWRALTDHPEASLLAFVAIKIFLILANSMPKERTISRFTHTDTRHRANQDARTIVAQAKVYQHLQREYRAAAKAAGKGSKQLKAHLSVGGDGFLLYGFFFRRQPKIAKTA